MKKTSLWIVQGAASENPKLFLKRVAALLEVQETLEMLGDGVPISAKMKDGKTLLEYVRQHHRSDAAQISNVFLMPNFTVRVVYKYPTKLYYKSKEDIEKNSSDFTVTRRESDGYVFEGNVQNDSACTVPLDTPGIDVTYI